jgi:hypothetical protein
MKRIALIAALLLVSISLFAASRLTINPADMKDGETKTLVDGDKTITVKKSGNDVDVKVEGGGKTKTITITNANGDIIIGRDGDGFRFKTFDHDFVPPRIFIDRSEIERHLPKMQSIFVCPKDHTVLRVPEDKADKEYKCPVDGTTMEKRKSRVFGLFMDGAEHDEL